MLGVDGEVRVLLLHPEFPMTFWSFKSVLDLVGKAALNPPLGLITVAAILPQHWEFKLVDCAIRPPTEAEWAFADIVLMTGMIVQKPSMMALIAESHRRGKAIAVGGPYATSVPQDFEEAGADYLVLDEGEITIAPFVDHLTTQGIQRRVAGQAAVRFGAKGEKPDLTETPVPRFDLLEMRKYDAMAVQFSRGCPFLCEFCDIITLYGRRPRTKTNAQVLAELQRLEELDWRGGVFLVDDNFIGNKPNVKKLLPELLKWQQEHGFPFWFDTEASIDLAADTELLAVMCACNFGSVFIGIETPDEASLKLTRKHQNNRVPMLTSLETITRSGLRVMCGMIIGFDNEEKGAGQRIVDFAEAANIPTVLLSMLQVLPNTGLWTRLEKEGRLLEGVGTINQTDLINFVPTRPVEEIAAEYVLAYQTLYDPSAYLERTYRHFRALGLNPPFAPPPAVAAPRRARSSARLLWHGLIGSLRNSRAAVVVIWRQGVVRKTRRAFWRNLFAIRRVNPTRLATYVAICAQAEHFIAYSAEIVEQMTLKIAAAKTARAAGVASPVAVAGKGAPPRLVAKRESASQKLDA